jgi:cytochrome c oxidase assembly protein subunit 15
MNFPGKLDSESFSLWPHRVAMLTAVVTFPLLFIGGLVTSKGAGLAVPDWPTTFGYNMFLYPWSKMVGGIFYEHSHRLVGSLVGACTIFLALALWLKESRRWLRWLGLAALAMVIGQGVLGGMRVVLLEDTLAIVHAALAQAFFAFVAAIAVFTSPQWRDTTLERRIEDGGKLLRLSAITTAMIYLQVVFGAVLRHTGERLDLHLVFAGLVIVHVILLFARVARNHWTQPKELRLTNLLGALLGGQLLLGASSYLGKYTTLWRLPVEAVVYLTTTHLALGALMLVASLILTLRVWRWSQGRAFSPARAVFQEQASL